MKKRRKKQSTKKSYTCRILGLIMAITVIAILGGILLKRSITESPEDTLVEYMNHIEKKEYEAMYAMIDSGEKGYLGKEEYIQRNSKIYEGIEVTDIKIDHIVIKEKKADTVTLSYESSSNTIAGAIQFDNMAELKKTKQGYKLVWQDSLIFPNLESDDKISVTTSKAERGEILDRNGKMLAGKGIATSVGIIPGKLEDRNVSLEKIAELLKIDVETINNKLTAKWVKEDSFVPIETIPKVKETDLMKIQPEEKTLEEQERQNKLLEIPGVMLSDVEVRSYELGEAAAHLIGYVQSVTAEDLENHPGEGYTNESVIGRSGLEKLYEKQLKGKDGCDIKILDSDGEEKEVLVPCMGTLLNKRKKDPRYIYKNGYEENKNLIAKNNLNSSIFTKFLEINNIKRYEYESCGYKIDIAEGNHSLHIPFYVTNTSQYCTLYAMCTTMNRGNQKLVKECPMYCSDYVFTYPKHLKMIGRYNSLFAFDDTSLKDSNSLEEYIKIAENCDTELKLILIELMNEVKKDNPERFSQPVNKFLTLTSLLYLSIDKTSLLTLASILYCDLNFSVLINTNLFALCIVPLK